MNKDNYKTLVKFLKITINIMMIIGLFSCISIVISVFILQYKGKISSRFIINGLIFFSGSGSLIGILNKLKKIMESVLKRSPFVMSNVRHLNSIALYCYTITFCYLINFIYNEQYKEFRLVSIDFSGVHTDTEFIIFFFAGCFILVLAQVYKQAIEVKEENDFTI